MQYHRIPQHVTGWEGRVFGHFTAHQFIYLAIGGMIIFVLFTNPFLPHFYKIGGIVVTGLLTVLFAIVNYEGRSTDVWILNYLRAILRPTQRIWGKIQEEPPAFLLPSYVVPQIRVGPKKKGSAELEEFLRVWGKSTKVSDLTEEEKEFLKKFKKMWWLNC